MAEDEKGFDSAGFYSALAATVRARGVTWKEVSRATKVSATTLARMGQGRQPDAAGLAALSAWSGLNPADYVKMEGKPKRAETLALISTVLSSDPSLTPDAADAIDAMVQNLYGRLRSNQ